LVVYPFVHATEVLRYYREFAATTTDALNTACATTARTRRRPRRSSHYSA
jgi:hypothetical protein